ncbi:MAG: SCO family protein [Chloroflexi bacterium]|nr:SCO family protein [Chloroflexota bacterium]
MPSQTLTRATAEETLAALVDAVKRSPDQRNTLLELLPERIDLYAGRSANAVVRMRGYILAAFEQVGLPHAGLRYVLEELQNGREAYLVAAAAMALRGYAQPDREFVPYLLAAIGNVRYADDAISFQTYKPHWPAPACTTALAEIFKTIAWLGADAQPALADLEQLSQHGSEFSPNVTVALAHALEHIRGAPRAAEMRECGCAPGPGEADDCCSLAAPDTTPHVPGARPTNVELQDQDGRTLRFAEFFQGTPSVVVFFYTRCDNPNKCSLTITKLARLQHELESADLAGSLKLAAISYDPGFDLPARLKAYGLNRGVAFGDNARFFRTLSAFQPLQDYFQLGVNFGDVLVNRHTIELFILDPLGQIVQAHTRLQWEPTDILDRARELITPSVLAGRA